MCNFLGPNCPDTPNSYTTILRGFINSKKQVIYYIYKTKWDKVSFAHDAANANSKHLAKQTVSDKVLKDRTYKIILNCKYDGYLRRLASTMYTFVIRKQYE